MLYLSPLSGELMKLRHPLLGCMRTPESDRGLPTPSTPWAADCGLKVATSTDPAGAERYFDWLERKRGDLPSCLFAVAPDVLGDAAACWDRSRPLLPRIRELGYSSAFVAQDGFDPSLIDPDAFDVLFIGGRPHEDKRQEWKRSESGGWAAIRWARSVGKPVHVGRVNGESYLRNLAAEGVRSADGTQLTWKSMVQRTMGWLDRLQAQPALWEAAS